MTSQSSATMLGLLFLGAATAGSADPMAMNQTGGDTDQAVITSAMSAAPASVSANATIAAMDASGKMRTLRKGTNGFTCVPDDPNSPGADPMCFDQPASPWLEAFLAHKPPPQPGKVGFVYMLAGGSDASNTDPFAKKPADGRWLATGPHVMVVGADPAFYAAYPSGPNPDTTQPYVMWAGAPWQHLMAPVK